MDAFTPRNVAQFVAKTIIQTQTAALVGTTITDHTRFDEDDTIVHIASGVTGWYVADLLKPYSDQMVDKAADWINARKAKKSAETPESE